MENYRNQFLLENLLGDKRWLSDLQLSNRFDETLASVGFKNDKNVNDDVEKRKSLLLNFFHQIKLFTTLLLPNIFQRWGRPERN